MKVNMTTVTRLEARATLVTVLIECWLLYVSSVAARHPSPSISNTVLHTSVQSKFALSLHWYMREKYGSLQTVLLCELTRGSSVYYWCMRERTTERVKARTKKGLEM